MDAPTLRFVFLLIVGFAAACGGGAGAGRSTTPDGAKAPPFSKCRDRSFLAAVELSADEAAIRRGFGAHRFSEVPSSQARPIEVCGVRGQVEWLTRVECNDGTNPFASQQHAHGARTGSVGEGGRCGSMIDRYKVPCPEGTYDVYMDLYMCGPGEAD